MQAMVCSIHAPCVASLSLPFARCPFYNPLSSCAGKSLRSPLGPKSQSPVFLRGRESGLQASNLGKLGFHAGKLGLRSKKRLLGGASYGSLDKETEAEGETSIGGLWVSKRDLQIAAGAALVIVFSVANRVLYKMALVPMKEYPFFLALFSTFGYVLVYFSMLYLRYRAHIVTDEMLKLPKSRFIAVGFLEALGVASGMAAAAVLPGASLPILVQTFLIWQLIFSMIFLKTRFSFFQIIGCSLVLVGVILALTSTSSGLTFSPDQTGLFWPLLMILSASFQAGASIIKEFVFRDASKRLQGGSVDIFVVNSFGSGFQSLFVFLLLPFLSQVRGIPFSQLPGYIRDGVGCLFNIGSNNTDCSNATVLTFGYIAVNLAFNISLLALLKNSSAVVTSLCTTLAVPLSIYVFTLPLPIVGAPASLPPQFLLGTAVLICGLAFYNFADRLNKKPKDV